ncbi:hypothetical protein G7Z17_g12856 [Cylindrodendrum hubeiense]|uniref:Glycosyl transferase CAP10 domain-containing protein n=1 Tax=Cylindrodendrum hubeiense TaxID=595255 RepID=A0A9P5GY63_9HYPO|nr:hypothetical protein G7Z17_g12856 [Cylindrodendrum hubeiense]
MWPRVKHWFWHWPSRLVLRYITILFFAGFFITNYFLWTSSQGWDVAEPNGPVTFGPKHPIKKLMVDARARHEALLAKRSYDLNDAAARYRARRGRHPPPGFDKWTEAALGSNAILVEDFFDRIYKDLTPFWALDSQTIAQRAASWHWVVRVRNGQATGQGNTTNRVPWLQLWTELVTEFSMHLPDVDMPINYMDEPRILVPFDEVAKLVEQERTNRRMPPVHEVVTGFKGLSQIDAMNPQLYEPHWFNRSDNYWDLTRVTCGPNAPSRNVEQISDFNTPVNYPSGWAPDYTYKGYIKNWTAAMDPCVQPHLREMHGSFVNPMSLSTTQELIPMFGGSKLPMNNEILIPGAMYLTVDEFYSGGENQRGPAWHRKKNGIVWRGVASGGKAKSYNWHRFHRHRLVQMLNGTTVNAMEHQDSKAQTFNFPDAEIYKNTRHTENRLGKWLKKFANAGFISRQCQVEPCEYLDPYYAEVDSMPMKDQYKYKFLPDADGNSFSARFRGFMRSSSTPLKATIYAEWHDDRLTPWVHFVPLDNSYQDLYSVLDYFTDDEVAGDTAARYIAERGKEWSEQVLRREDMRLYVWRLLLEWARVCDENRHNLGFIKDLIDPQR